VAIKNVHKKIFEIQDLVSAFNAETQRREHGVVDMNVTATSFKSILEKIEKQQHLFYKFQHQRNNNKPPTSKLCLFFMGCQKKR
jgi:hypothetical protein